MKKQNAKLLSLVAFAMIFVSCGNTTKPVSNSEDSTAVEQTDTVAEAFDYDDDAKVLARYEAEGTGRAADNDSQGKKIVYLTFDDGPSSNTPKVLNILKENNVHATFFVTGSHKDYLHYIRRAYEEGNAIGAHCNLHEYSLYQTKDTYFDDLEKIEQVIEQQTGHRTNIIRFPGGSSNTVYHKQNNDPLFMIRLTQMVRDKGYQYVDWNGSNGDASPVKRTTPELIAKACRASRNDICLLMHDTFGKERTVEALPSIIKFFKDKGYEFGTITDTNYTCHHGIKPFGKYTPGSAQKPATAIASTTGTAKPASDKDKKVKKGDKDKKKDDKKSEKKSKKTNKELPEPSTPIPAENVNVEAEV